MNSNQTTDNRRILVIDDNASIHEDFRKILAPPKDPDSLSQARAALFGEVPTLPPQVQYELEFASQGREGFGLVQTLIREAISMRWRLWTCGCRRDGMGSRPSSIFGTPNLISES